MALTSHFRGGSKRRVQGVHPLSPRDEVFLGVRVRSSCIIQDNLCDLTVNNKYIIRVRKKSKGEVCITTDNLNRIHNVHFIGKLMKNDRLFHLQGLHNFVFDFLSCCCGEHNK